ncbi:MAG: sigma-54-dependent Fis family transcriptional regulator [Candidatus Eisenbacteria bacterium]|nr:sigma-54-dependent Fis family transcriptional regulator [Candidatus Eisenbacteria bacterium]
MGAFRQGSRKDTAYPETPSVTDPKEVTRDDQPGEAEDRLDTGSSGPGSPLVGLAGRSRQIQHIRELVQKVALSEATVLIEGETGTGKELVARAVHALSPRRAKRFLAHNCGATPDTLIESELFGHVKGAFTGAVEDKKGLFEAADQGTFFLDEIADVSAMMQMKLLRVLQEREFRRVGETQHRRINVRIVAATNRELLREVEAGRFRRDLYYRLSVIKLKLPPLRERREDVPVLAKRFLLKQARRIGLGEIQLEKEAMEALVAYDWPGNVRELENELERAVTLALPAPRISVYLLSEAVRSAKSSLACSTRAAGTLRYETERVERKKILEALDSCRWNKTHASQVLGLSRQGLLKKMRRFGIVARKAPSAPAKCSDAPPGPLDDDPGHEGPGQGATG